jgi:hypothetical protein
MTSFKVAPLADRGVVRVSGADAAKLLQGLITADLDLLDKQPSIFSGLLTPQGKILFDFFVVKSGEEFLLETLREKAADLAKRLTFYKLRAKADIADISDAHSVAVLWGGPEPSIKGAVVVYPDPRREELGWRAIAPAGFDWASVSGAEVVTEQAYHEHRISVGAPEGGQDYLLGDTFPHEALFDQTGGVSFTKGCFVGQEVVSRMEHRSTARKRVVPIVGQEPLQPGADVKAGEAVVGTVGSTAGNRGLALLRLDRVGEAMSKGQPITAGGVPVSVELPSWVRFTIPTKDAAQV